MTPLRLRMTEDMQVRNLSPRTQSTYLMQVSLFARHFGQSPALLGPEQIRNYQLFLTNRKKMSPSSGRSRGPALPLSGHQAGMGHRGPFPLPSDPANFPSSPVPSSTSSVRPASSTVPS